uniref:Uncharacterized protein n=1 Tax=Vannella robusta TaxID=1487602 RepID=A0A7S4IBS8_9EUKA|mmetsp:Transcript_23453/g.29897  ORF Transcript_23453/g.29897 Transcript_23453/m.29897 type:complete len:226 (+) Transcript_23453:1-678(+)
MLQEFTTTWCGTIILADCEGTQVTIITLFNCPKAMAELDARGFLQKQMKLFQNLMADIPTFAEYHVKQDTFHMISPLEGLRSSLSTSVQSLPELGNFSTEDKKTVDFSKEPVLDSFFAILCYLTEVSVGHIFICAEHIRFKGRKSLSRSGERIVSLHLRDLVSMDENRPFGRSGHTLTFVTSNGSVLILKSLLKRDKLMRLIQQQVDKLDPPHNIIHMLNGEWHL